MVFKFKNNFGKNKDILDGDKYRSEVEKDTNKRSWGKSLKEASGDIAKDTLRSLNPDITRISDELKKSRKKNNEINRMEIPKIDDSSYLEFKEFSDSKISKLSIPEKENNIKNTKNRIKLELKKTNKKDGTIDLEGKLDENQNSESIVRSPLANTINDSMVSLIQVNSKGFGAIINSLSSLGNNSILMARKEEETLGILNSSFKRLEKITNVSSSSSLQQNNLVENLVNGNLSISSFTKAIAINTERQNRLGFRDNSYKGMMGFRNTAEFMNYLKENPKSAVSGLILSQAIKTLDTKGYTTKLNDRFRDLSFDVFDYVQNDKLKDNKYLGKLIDLSDRFSKTKLVKNRRFSDYLSKESLQGKLGDISRRLNINLFGGKYDGEVNTKNSLAKGTAVNFDAETHNTINKVIPGYLAKILSSITGNPEIYNDYGTGKWMTKSGLLKRKEMMTGISNKNNMRLSKVKSDIFGGKSEDSDKLFAEIIKNNSLDPDSLEKLRNDKNSELIDKVKSYITDDSKIGKMNNRLFRNAVTSARMNVSKIGKTLYSGSASNAFAGEENNSSILDNINTNIDKNIDLNQETDSQLNYLNLTITEIRDILDNYFDRGIGSSYNPNSPTSPNNSNLKDKISEVKDTVNDIKEGNISSVAKKLSGGKFTTGGIISSQAVKDLNGGKDPSSKARSSFGDILNEFSDKDKESKGDINDVSSKLDDIIKDREKKVSEVNGPEDFINKKLKENSDVLNDKKNNKTSIDFLDSLAKGEGSLGGTIGKITGGTAISKLGGGKLTKIIKGLTGKKSGMLLGGLGAGIIGSLLFASQNASADSIGGNISGGGSPLDGIFGGNLNMAGAGSNGIDSALNAFGGKSVMDTVTNQINSNIDPSLLNSMNGDPTGFSKQLLSMTPIGSLAIMSKNGMNPSDPSESVMNKIGRWFDKLTKTAKASASSSSGSSSGGSSGGNSSSSGGSASVPGDKKAFLKLNVGNDFGVDEAKMLAGAKKSARVMSWLGGKDENIKKVASIVKSNGMSPELFFAYDIQEQGTSWGWLNHTSYTGDPYSDADSVSKWAVSQANSTGKVQLAWYDAGNPYYTTPADKQTEGQKFADSLPAGAIGRMYLSGTAAATWAAFDPDGLKASVNQVQNYGDPIQGCMDLIKSWGGKSSKASKSDDKKSSATPSSSSGSSMGSTGGGSGSSSSSSKNSRSKGNGQGDIKSKSSGNSGIEKMIKWGESKVGNTHYSQGERGPRTGPNSYDCSGFVMSAMIEGGFLPKGTSIGNTETLFGMEGGVLKPLSGRGEVQRGDIFVSGYKGSSLGNDGHTGIFLDNGQNILHATLAGPYDGVVKSPATGWMGDYKGLPVHYYRIEGVGNVDSSTASVSSEDSSGGGSTESDETKWKLSEEEQEKIYQRVLKKYTKMYGENAKGASSAEPSSKDKNSSTGGSSSASSSNGSSSSNSSNGNSSNGSSSNGNGGNSSSNSSNNGNNSSNSSSGDSGGSTAEIPGGVTITNNYYNTTNNSTNNYYEKVDDEINTEKIDALKSILNTVNNIGRYTKSSVDKLQKIINEIIDSNKLIDKNNDLSEELNDILSKIKVINNGNNGNNSGDGGDINDDELYDFRLNISSLDPILEGIR